MKDIITFGSIVVDLVLNPPKLPAPGETVTSTSYALLPGGKGANQAYAAAKSDPTSKSKVVMVGAVGDDALRKLALDDLEEANVDVSSVNLRKDLPTACAAVCVDAKGENQIIVGSAANQSVSMQQLPPLDSEKVLLMQMEIPHDQNWAAVKAAYSAGATTVINVAPAGPVPADTLRMLDYVIVNELEACTLAEHVGLSVEGQSETELGRQIAMLYGTTVVVTLGANGAAV
ncbi:hypothetical protein CYMTET_33138, partial [Cymbomonas tetramitiformis]